MFGGNNNKEIALSELRVVPSFLRFDQISLDYSSCKMKSQSIAEKCESFSRYLASIRASLYDSNMIHFECEINEESPWQFNNYATLLEQIRHILSICDSSRGYSFGFADINSRDSDAIGNMISSILEMPATARSSFVSFISQYTPLAHLPIEAISIWLNRECNALDQNQQEREFTLSYLVTGAQIQEMVDFLKQVRFHSLRPFINLSFTN